MGTLLKPCINCGTPDHLRKGRCNGCSQFLRNHGRDSLPEERRVAARRPLAECADCGRQARLSKGSCRRCRQYLLDHGKRWTPEVIRKPAEPKVPKLVPIKPCVNCEGSDGYRLGRCDACYRTYAKTGYDRDPGTIRRRKPKALCINCKTRGARHGTRCNRCYLHWWRHGVDLVDVNKPFLVLDKPVPPVNRKPKDSEPTERHCSVCNRVIGLHSTTGRCGSCQSFWKKHGRDSEPHERRRRAKWGEKLPDRVCANCEKYTVDSKNLCSRCYYFKRTYGLTWSPEAAAKVGYQGVGSRPKTERPCTNCGGPCLLARKGRCPECAYYFKRFKQERPVDGAVAPVPPDRLCVDCEERGAVAKSQCGRCYAFEKRHGVKWTRVQQEQAKKLKSEKLSEKLSARQPKTLQPCIHCGKEVLRFKPGRCVTCQSYWGHNKRERPLDKGKHKPCSNCGITREPYLAKGRCSLCRKHWNTYGIERATDLLPGESHPSRRKALGSIATERKTQPS